MQIFKILSHIPGFLLFLRITSNPTNEYPRSGIGLGRKKWLFSGNHQSAERSAIIYSITESPILNNIAPFSDLKDVLARLPYLIFATKEKLDELLPINWKP